ncbi:hypothetical protein [Streptomyces sp. SAS_270]|uniref:hypothetical protein n=1 Tax=Streptomyces sp. SAS_270 TaxID=3412748 RepID=UPI00403C348F
MNDGELDREQDTFDVWEARVAEEITELLADPLTMQETLQAIQRQAQPDESPTRDTSSAGRIVRGRGQDRWVLSESAEPTPYPRPTRASLLDGQPSVPQGPPEPLRATAATRQDDSAAGDRIRIGLWGAPRAGKTTYLAALPIAAMQAQRHGEANWLIAGTTAKANAFLNEGVTKLAVERTFPTATDSLEGVSWSFQGRTPAVGLLRKRHRDAKFVLELQDAPGEAFRTESPLHTRVVDQLADAQGLIYFFDPLGEASETAQGLTHFLSTLTELSQRISSAGRQDRGRLPHQVSVCITKFDHPDIFRPAVEAGWVTQETAASLPSVPVHLAEGYFQWLCDDSRSTSARLVRDGLAAYFHPERVAYYATSAVGFRLNSQHVFDYRDYANVEFVGGAARLVTSPEPINVLEPLTDLERRIRTTKDARRPRHR